MGAARTVTQLQVCALTPVSTLIDTAEMCGNGARCRRGCPNLEDFGDPELRPRELEFLEDVDDVDELEDEYHDEYDADDGDETAARRQVLEISGQ